ncbi:hypothetical protein JCM10207_007291 [Rhodosporidiobolus poonsookiae]
MSPTSSRSRSASPPPFSLSSLSPTNLVDHLVMACEEHDALFVLFWLRALKDRGCLDWARNKHSWRDLTALDALAAAPPTDLRAVLVELLRTALSSIAEGSQRFRSVEVGGASAEIHCGLGEAPLESTAAKQGRTLFEFDDDAEAADWIDANLPPPPRPDKLTGFAPLPPRPTTAPLSPGRAYSSAYELGGQLSTPIEPSSPALSNVSFHSSSSQKAAFPTPPAPTTAQTHTTPSTSKTVKLYPVTAGSTPGALLTQLPRLEGLADLSFTDNGAAAHLSFLTRSAAQKALSKLNGTDVAGRCLSAELVESQTSSLPAKPPAWLPISLQPSTTARLAPPRTVDALSPTLPAKPLAHPLPARAPLRSRSRSSSPPPRQSGPFHLRLYNLPPQCAVNQVNAHLHALRLPFSAKHGPPVRGGAAPDVRLTLPDRATCARFDAALAQNPLGGYRIQLERAPPPPSEQGSATHPVVTLRYGVAGARGALTKERVERLPESVRCGAYGARVSLREVASGAEGSSKQLREAGEAEEWEVEEVASFRVASPASADAAVRALDARLTYHGVLTARWGWADEREGLKRGAEETEVTASLDGGARGKRKRARRT